MKKTLLISAMFVLLSTGVYANGFLTLGYDYAFQGKNDLLSSASSRVSYFNIDGGYLFDGGVSASLKYDHISMEDFEYSGDNARVIAVVPSVGIGYALEFMEGSLIWWSNVYAGYAVSVRFRQGITDHKASGFAPSLTTALYYKLKGQFYAGVETGYRYLKVKYTDIAGEPGLDLSGIFCGVSLKHIFE